MAEDMPYPKAQEKVQDKTAKERRTHLLARMAGNIVGGILAIAPDGVTQDQIADASVSYAKKILARLEA